MTDRKDTRDKPQTLETRSVEVDEPQLSAATNREMTEDLRDVIGADHVDVPADRAHPSHGDRPTRSGPRAVPLPNNFIVTMLSATLIIVGVIVALSTGHWWLLPPAVILLGFLTYVIVAMILRMTSNSERPSPATVAAMEEDGISDPERHFSEVVAEFTEESGDSGDNERMTSVEEDPVKAAAEQRSAITPSGGATQPVGPGASS